MPAIGDDDDVGEVELVAHAEVNKSAWSMTLEEMQAMAEGREDDGWRTVSIGAGHTAPESPRMGDDDRYGLTYVIPGNLAPPFREAYERGDFPLYDVFRGETETRTFLVTELLDHDSKTAIYLAGNFRHHDALELAETVVETGTMYTHVTKLDGTLLGSFEHEGYEKFFPPQVLASVVPGDEEDPAQADATEE